MLLSVTCRAQALTERYIVELQQNTDSPDKSFSIEQLAQSRLPGDPSIIAKINNYEGSDSPANNIPPGPGGYLLKTTIIESISWHLLYATNLLFVYELILTSHITSQGSKTYSQLPLEAFIAVGSLLNSYWNPDSPMFNPIGQQESNKDYPFVINTMTLSPGDNQQQGQPSESSTQQASGTTSRLRGTISSRQHSDSGGGDEEPQHHRHTLGLNCFTDNCNGVCKFRQSGARPKTRSRLYKDSDPQSLPSEKVGFSFSLTQTTSPSPAGSSETQPTTAQTTELSQPGQSQAHLSQTDTVKAPSVFRKGYFSSQKTCDMPTKRTRSRLRPWGRVCKSSHSLSVQISEHHSRRESPQEALASITPPPVSRLWKKFCAALGRNQPDFPQTGTVKAPSGNQKRYRTGSETCDLPVDQRPRPCRRLCKNARQLNKQARIAHLRMPVGANRGLSPPEVNQNHPTPKRGRG
ncbi:hypothetical protein [Endozoicomonas sp. 8E]|uniref:hypothetical protein n=1 Tax=Endozoicomonas sp. 8E TaxID=3035692 RepID=UPI0029394CEE|nr:hypothetical protein [Endozoicomonas sp. 8E]WOG26911.1 hypothetical protein P6910_20535 [Endozoicomonas sp. 8E]